MELRILAIAILAAAVVGTALLTRRWQRPVHRTVSVAGRGFPPGYVVFTSTECDNCKAALSVVKATGEPLREVTWELEPALMEELGIESVPLVIRIGDDKEAISQIVGVPSSRWLRRTSR